MAVNYRALRRALKVWPIIEKDWRQLKWTALLPEKPFYREAFVRAWREGRAVVGAETLY